MDKFKKMSEEEQRIEHEEALVMSAMMQELARKDQYDKAQQEKIQQIDDERMKRDAP